MSDRHPYTTSRDNDNPGPWVSPFNLPGYHPEENQHLSAGEKLGAAREVGHNHAARLAEEARAAQTSTSGPRSAAEGTLDPRFAFAPNPAVPQPSPRKPKAKMSERERFIDQIDKVWDGIAFYNLFDLEQCPTHAKGWHMVDPDEWPTSLFRNFCRLARNIEDGKLAKDWIMYQTEKRYDGILFCDGSAPKRNVRGVLAGDVEEACEMLEKHYDDFEKFVKARNGDDDVEMGGDEARRRGTRSRSVPPPVITLNDEPISPADASRAPRDSRRKPPPQSRQKNKQKRKQKEQQDEESEEEPEEQPKTTGLGRGKTVPKREDRLTYAEVKAGKQPSEPIRMLREDEVGTEAQFGGFSDWSSSSDEGRPVRPRRNRRKAGSARGRSTTERANRTAKPQQQTNMSQEKKDVRVAEQPPEKPDDSSPLSSAKGSDELEGVGTGDAAQRNAQDQGKLAGDGHFGGQDEELGDGKIGNTGEMDGRIEGDEGYPREKDNSGKDDQEDTVMDDNDDGDGDDGHDHDGHGAAPGNLTGSTDSDSFRTANTTLDLYTQPPDTEASRTLLHDENLPRSEPIQPENSPEPTYSPQAPPEHFPTSPNPHPDSPTEASHDHTGNSSSSSALVPSPPRPRKHATHVPRGPQPKRRPTYLTREVMEGKRKLEDTSFDTDMELEDWEEMQQLSIVARNRVNAEYDSMDLRLRIGKRMRMDEDAAEEEERRRRGGRDPEGTSGDEEPDDEEQGEHSDGDEDGQQGGAPKGYYRH